MDPMRIRPIVPADVPKIREIVTAAGNFNADEIATAMELVDETLRQGPASGYTIVVAELPQILAIEGYACYGPTPLTEGVYDLYWIAVHPNAQGQGVGGRLVKYVEDEIRSLGGRMLLIETSSREGYDPTIRFYHRMKYELEARIKNFYRIGDDKLVFCKQLSPQKEQESSNRKPGA